MRARPRAVLLLSAGLALAFVLSALHWSSHSARPLHWGDACVAALRVLEASDSMAGLRGWARWTSAEVWTRTTRAPLLHWLGLLWIRLPGLDARHLDLLPAVLLGLGGGLTSLAVARSRCSLAAGAVAGLVLLGSPQAVVQAHSFFLSTAALLFTGLALVGVEGLVRGRRLAALWLGLGLGGALLSRHNAAASLVLPVLLWCLPGLWRQLRRAPLGLLSGSWLLPAVVLAGHLLARASGEPGRWLTTGPLLLLGTLALAPAAALVGRRGAERARALWLGAALATPWWLGHHELIASHLANSDAGRGSRSTVADLLSLMAQVVGLQQLGVVLVPLGLAGLVLALWRRREPLEGFALVALACAFALPTLYFHSRYLLPLLPFVAVLAAAAVPVRGVAWLRRGLVVAAGLLALVHHLGWRIGLPGIPADLVRDEHRGWIEHELGLAADLRRPWLSPVATVAPLEGPDLMAEALASISADCPVHQACWVHVPPPPLGMLGLSTYDDWDWLRWQLQRHGSAWRLKLVDHAPQRGRLYVLVLRRSGEGELPELRGARRQAWQVLWPPRPVGDGTVELWVSKAPR